MRNQSAIARPGASVVAIALSLVAAPALAQSQPNADADEGTGSQAGQDAQDKVDQSGSRVSDALMGTIVVTARRKSKAEALQEVPIAVSAFGEKQIELLKIDGVADVGRYVPNVELSQIGTQKGTANFSIRGMGINVSQPSLDPTVGVFIDNVYMGTSFGIVTDNFDIASIEVLRGPQGVLFGRNVTGGAIQIGTRNPTRNFEAYVKAAYETGDDIILQGAISGPLVPDKLLVRVAIYDDNDRGYFYNRLTGKDVGRLHTTIVRTGLTYLPSTSSELTVKYEHGVMTGDGAVGRNFAIFPDIKSDHDVNLDYPAYTDDQWDFVSANFQADLGAGTITNILGYKDTVVRTGYDADQTPMNTFHTRYNYKMDQFSEELRYNVAIGDLADVTAGLYYFTQKMTTIEDRTVFATSVRTGGGKQNQDTYGAYASVDWNLAPGLKLTTGGRYSYEKKHAQIIRVLAVNTPLCSVDRRECSTYPFDDKDNWSSFSPKVGVQYIASSDTQFYGSYTRGFRSGGYNLRLTDTTSSPGPFDQEEQDAFEVGLKTDLFDRRVRFNAAAFINKFKNLQRTVTRASIVGGGTTQDIVNSADATIKGIEAEATFLITDNLVFAANVGLLDGNYDKVFFDINNDGKIDQKDKDLRIPRLAKTSIGANLTYEREIAGKLRMTALGSYSYRSSSASTDGNEGIIPKSNVVDASLAIGTLDDRLTLTLYGKNLTDEVLYGSVNPLPAAPQFGYSGTTLPTTTQLGKGRVIGVEFAAKFR